LEKRAKSTNALESTRVHILMTIVDTSRPGFDTRCRRILKFSLVADFKSISDSPAARPNHTSQGYQQLVLLEVETFLYYFRPNQEKKLTFKIVHMFYPSFFEDSFVFDFLS
jgi:hypothetical protein